MFLVNFVSFVSFDGDYWSDVTWKMMKVSL